MVSCVYSAREAGVEAEPAISCSVHPRGLGGEGQVDTGGKVRPKGDTEAAGGGSVREEAVTCERMVSVDCRIEELGEVVAVGKVKEAQDCLGEGLGGEA